MKKIDKQLSYAPAEFRVSYCGWASPAMRELDLLHDLTAENGVTQTLQNLKFIKDVACDHILVNDQIKVNSFNVHDQLVSDHKTISADVEII